MTINSWIQVGFECGSILFVRDGNKTHKFISGSSFAPMGVGEEPFFSS
jgi:hypothetical protein